MEATRRRGLIYGLLLGVWALVVVWQFEEHVRVRNEAHAFLENRAKDISTTLSIVMRSQRRFGGLVSKERLEASLTELVKQEKADLKGIALLNATGQMVASAGTETNFQPGAIAGATERWDEHTVTLVNPVDLGTNVFFDFEGTNPPIIFSREDFTNRFVGNRPEMPPPGPPRPESTNSDRLRERGFRSRFGRPPWMSEEDYQAVVQKQGVHSMVIVMSTQPARAVISQDFWLRSIIAMLATFSLVGSGLVWRSLGQSSDLQLRLVRASEVNTHLKEMNLAAAGLAHETRNPLNIIRGMAQMISKEEAAPAEVREKSRAIVDETDKVTVQLNEFINYSRPREVRRTKLALNSAVNEVVRTLSHDLEEKKISFEVKGEPITIEADEQLLRQVLFNLSLNAIQAVGENGLIQILMHKTGSSEASLEIRDNGPGVPPERRREIFKPYFTTHQKGTGLGLAIVQQIVLVHGWEIQCLANEPKGAVFCITHLKIAT